MKKTLIAGLLLAFCLPINALAATASTTIGNTLCRFTSSTVPNIIDPFYATQTEHTYGISTTIGISKSESNTLSSGISASYTASLAFAQVSGELNCQNSATQSISTSQSWTIPSAKASGLYRVEAVFPRYSLKYEEFDMDTAERTFTITYDHTPKYHASYKRLYKYRSL